MSSQDISRANNIIYPCENRYMLVISVPGGHKMSIRYNREKATKTLGPKASLLVTTLYEKSRTIFRLRDVMDILKMDNRKAANFIRKLVDRGVVARLRPGLYALIPFEIGTSREYAGNPYLIARALVGGKDYYVSHGSAMEIHGMTTQPQFRVYVSVLRRVRNVTVSGIEFVFVRVKKEHYFGATEHWATKQEKVLVSDPEKTIVDGLLRPEYCGGVSEVAKALWIARDALDVNRLTLYALKVGKGSVIRRLGFLLELYDMGSWENREMLKLHLTKTYSLLDPNLPPEGKFYSKWKLRLNVTPEELMAITRT